MPVAPGVNTRLAPNALSKLRRSTLMVSGMVRVSLYPFMAATMASPIPVLPLVGSMISAPGFKIPAASASSIIAKAIRSFTQPAGLNDSNFAITVASNPFFAL